MSIDFDYNFGSWLTEDLKEFFLSIEQIWVLKVQKKPMMLFRIVVMM